MKAPIHRVLIAKHHAYTGKTKAEFQNSHICRFTAGRPLWWTEVCRWKWSRFAKSSLRTRCKPSYVTQNEKLNFSEQVHSCLMKACLELGGPGGHHPWLEPTKYLPTAVPKPCGWRSQLFPCLDVGCEDLPNRLSQDQSTSVWSLCYKGVLV